jgi:hypothetical protein
LRCTVERERGREEEAGEGMVCCVPVVDIVMRRRAEEEEDGMRLTHLESSKSL